MVTSCGSTPNTRERRGVVDVGAAAERFDQAWVSREVGDAAQLDLVVVGDEQLVTRRRNERLAELTTLIAAHRDVVQVGLVAAEPSGARHGLVERRMDATVGGDLGHQAGAVRAAQLLHLAVLHQRIDELRPLIAKSQEGRRIGRVAGLRLLLRRQLLLGVEQLAELHR